MAKRNRQRKPARRSPYKDSKPLILVVTEGKFTEPEYLETFARYYKNSRVKVQVHRDAGVPKTIVETAKELKAENKKEAKAQKDENLKFDEVWCVFDIDEHPNIPQAVDMARSNGFQLAISNPCIELWLWLHFAPQPGLRHRHDLQAMLKEQYLPDYDKHIDFAEMSSGYQNAVDRAKRLEKDAEEENDAGRNPTTGIWRLTQSIIEEKASQ